MKILFPLIVSCWAMAGFVPYANASIRLYGVTFFGNELLSINRTTGVATSVGALDANVTTYGIAARYGRLYGFDPNLDQIVEISPATGKAIKHLSIGLSNLTGEGDLAFRGDGMGFLTSALGPDGTPVNDIYTFDVLSGTSHRLGTTGVAIDALAFDWDDQLFALGQGDGVLYRINQMTGLATKVGDLGIQQNSPFAALAFAPNGDLFAAIDDRLYRLNTILGTAVPVSTSELDFGYSSVSGLAFQRPEAKDYLYGLAFFSNELLSVDPDTGEATSVGSPGSNVTGYGLASRGKRLYTFNPNNDRLQELNPMNGSILETIDVGLGDLTGEGDLAFRSDGIGFISSAFSSSPGVANGLYRFDILSHTSTRVGVTSVALDAMTFAPDDRLFAIGQGDGMVYIVNQDDASLTALGPLDVAQNSPFAGMAFAPDGTLYAAIDDRLHRVNPYTGKAFVVDSTVLDFGFSSISGLTYAFAPSALSILSERGGLALFWDQSGYTLEVSDQVTGPWKVADSQENPQRVASVGGRHFFRLRL